MHNTAVALCFSLLLVGPLGCDGQSETEPFAATAGDIAIAVVGPLSGSNAAAGEMLRKGVELKVSELPDGKIAGRNIKLVFEDDAGKPEEAVNISRKLATDKSVSIVIGHYNSVCTNKAKEEYNRRGLPQLTPASTNVNVCVDYDWTFRNLYRDDYQGTFLARYAKTVLGATKAAVFFEKDDYGEGLKNAFEKEAAAAGLEIAYSKSYLREKTLDFKGIVQPIKGSGVDVVFISGLYNEPALITKTIRELGVQVPILGGDGLMNAEFIDIAGAAAEGVFITTPFLFDAVQDDKAARRFMKTFHDKFGRDPDTWAALAYDAVGMAIEAIRQVGPGRKAIRDWLASVTSPENAYQGVTGPTYFDKEGDCYCKGAHVACVKDGRFTVAEMQMKLDQ